MRKTSKLGENAVERSNINILPENSSTAKREQDNDVWQAFGDLFFKEVQVQPRFDVRADFFFSFAIGETV